MSCAWGTELDAHVARLVITAHVIWKCDARACHLCGATQVPSTWYQVSDTRTWYQVTGTKDPAPGNWYQVQVFATKYLVPQVSAATRMSLI